MTEREAGWTWSARVAGFVGAFVACGFAGALLAQLFARPASTVAAALAWPNLLPVLAAALAATWLFAVMVDRRGLRWLGLHGGVRGATELILGTAAGAVIVGLPVLALAALGWVSWTALASSSLWRGAELSVLVFGAAFAEELLFRGYPFRVLQARFGPVAAVLATSVAFGLAHGANPGIGPLAFVNLGLAGVLLGVAYWRTRSLWFVSGIHFGWNWVMAASGLSVSGLDVSISGLRGELTGPTLWTGGAFGPEGGLLVTLVTAAGTVWLWRIGGVARGSARRAPGGPGRPPDGRGETGADGDASV